MHLETLRQKVYSTELAVFKLFTFAVVKKLLREDWYVKHSSVFPFCIFLFIHRDSKRKED